MKSLLDSIIGKLSLSPWKERLLGRRHVILTFHRIRPNNQPRDPFDTCPNHTIKQFEEAIRNIRNTHQIVALEDFVNRLSSRKPMAAITFDDGWRDNYDIAFPILKMMGLPASLFVTTGKIGSILPFWQQHLGNLFRMAVGHQNGDLAKQLRHHLHWDSRRQIDAPSYRQEVARRKTLIQPVCGALERKFNDLLANRYTERCFVNANELLNMADGCFSIGSHTHSHPLLTNVSEDCVIRELTESRVIVESICQKPCNSIAYPNGNTNTHLEAIAKQVGYEIACTTESRHCGPKEDLLRLPREEPQWDK